MDHRIDPTKWLRERSRRYHAKGISRKEKTAIKQEIRQVTGWHDKSVLRVLGKRPHLSAKPAASACRGGHPRLLGKAAAGALHNLWRLVGCPSSERLAAMLPDLVASAAGHVPGFTAETGAQLLSVSASTLERTLRERRGGIKRGRRAGAGSAAAARLRDQVEVSVSRPADSPPGWFDFDTVAHCGGDLRGEVAWTLNGTDVGSGWTLLVTLPHCRAGDVVHALRGMRDTSPLLFRHIHTDNGGEFVNHQLRKVCAHRGIGLSRSRPGKSNDNPRVEQKNFTHVRGTFGYGRYEKQEVAQMNRINDILMLLVNLFGVSARLVSKTREGAKIHRVYDRPQTPLRRVEEYYRRHGLPLPAEVRALAEKKKTLNPFQLHRRLEEELERLRIIRRERMRQDKKEKFYA